MELLLSHANVTILAVHTILLTEQAAEVGMPSDSGVSAAALQLPACYLFDPVHAVVNVDLGSEKDFY